MGSDRKVEIKPFGTLGVVGAWSGFVLEHGGMGEIHRVMDHLYPGIMTLGIAAMQPHASAYLLESIPALAELGEMVEGEHATYAAKALALFGATIDVLGPLLVGDDEVDAQFAKMRARHSITRCRLTRDEVNSR